MINNKFSYDTMIGWKFMSKHHFQLDSSDTKVVWYDKEISLYARSCFENNNLIKKVLSNEAVAVAVTVAETEAEAYNAQSVQTLFVDSSKKYKETNIKALVREQAHLDQDTKNKLRVILLANKKIFESLEGKALSIFPDWEFHIELILSAVSFHVKQP